MVTCAWCGATLVDPRPCSYCGSQYCEDHRFPEHHECSGVDDANSEGLFDSGFDDSVSA